MARRSSAAASSRLGSSSSQGPAIPGDSRTPPPPKRTPRRLKQPDATASSLSSRRSASRRKEQEWEEAGKHRDPAQLDAVEDHPSAAELPSKRRSRAVKNPDEGVLKENEGPAGSNGDEEEEEQQEGREESEEDKGEAKILGEGFYEVEAVKGKRTRKGKLQYLVKWQGWSESANTWEPYDNLKHCDDIIQVFEESHKAKVGRKKRKSGTYLSSQTKKHMPGLTVDEGIAPKTKENVEDHVPFKMDPSVGIDIIDITEESGAEKGIAAIPDNSNPGKLEAVNAVRSPDAITTANGNCTLEGETLISDITQKELVQYDTRSTRPELRTVNKEDSKKRLVKVPIIEDEDPGKLAGKDKQTGAKKRKQGFVRRVRQGVEFQEHGKRQACKEERMIDIEQVNVNAKAVNGGISEDEVKGIQKAETHSQSCDNLGIIEIIKAVSYSSSTANNKQDVSVLFKVTRSDGQEVMVDNKFLRDNHPLLLIDFYEQHLRYSTTQ